MSTPRAETGRQRPATQRRGRGYDQRPRRRRLRPRSKVQWSASTGDKAAALSKLRAEGSIAAVPRRRPSVHSRRPGRHRNKAAVAAAKEGHAYVTSSRYRPRHHQLGCLCPRGWRAHRHRQRRGLPHHPVGRRLHQGRRGARRRDRQAPGRHERRPHHRVGQAPHGHRLDPRSTARSTPRRRSRPACSGS